MHKELTHSVLTMGFAMAELLIAAQVMGAAALSGTQSFLPAHNLCERGAGLLAMSKLGAENRVSFPTAGIEVESLAGASYCAHLNMAPAAMDTS